MNSSEIFNGVVLGIVSSALFSIFYHPFNQYRNKLRYGKISGNFLGYGHKSGISGDLNESPLSSAEVKYISDNKLEISVTHTNITWVGEISLTTPKHGLIVWQYTDDEYNHFYGFKKLIVQNDFSKLIVIGKKERGYGTEVFIRMGRS